MQRDEIIERLRAVGYRVTSQREALLDVIRSFEGHFTAEEINMALRQTTTSIDLSTIYRTLDLLCQMGVIHPLVGSSPAEYEWVHEPHHHLICEECGATIALAAYHFDELYRHLLEEHQFEADLTHLAIPGRCTGCQSQRTD